MNQKLPFLSIICPVFNENQTIDKFLSVIIPILENICAYEIIFIDDGSTDTTAEVIKNKIDQNKNIQLIKFSKNFGKEIALTAGLDYCNGEAAIPIDVDLQDPPEIIPKFIEKWKDGIDIVYGIRKCRKNDSVFKRITAEFFYKIFNCVAHNTIPNNVGDFRLIDRKVIEEIKKIKEKNRFMKGIFAWVGFKSIGIEYERANRSIGTTKWPYKKLWNFAMDGIFSFSTLPLKIWTYVGAIISFLSFLCAAFIIIKTLLFGKDSPGYASIMTGILFLGGLQLFSVGILGEYIGRIFIEVKNRPLYIIENIYKYKNL